MRTFSFELSARIYFGNHTVAEALKKERDCLRGNVMIVTTGNSLVRHGYVEQLKGLLGQLPEIGETVLFEGISQNPRLQEAEEAVKLGRENRVSAVIGLGGGSSIDAAKAVAAGIGTGESISSFLLDGKEPSEKVLPIIAIPTTAGTGSELSQGAILSSPEHHIKAGIRSRYLQPTVAIVDPVYTWTVPPDITMETGFDVLAHAIESFMAVKADPVSEMLSEKAIKTVGENLPVLFYYPENHEAREAMSFVSMLMGINLARAGTCFPHRMQYAVGAQTDTGHAKGLAALYPAWTEKEYDVNREKMEQALCWLTGERVSNGKGAKECMAGFMKQTGLLKNLTSLGITREDIEYLTENVTGNLENDKLGAQKGIVEQIFRESV